MLEIFSYPIVDEVRIRNLSFTKFWENIAEYVLSKKGIIIYGEDENLYYQALQKIGELDQEQGKLRMEYCTKMEVWRQEYPLHQRYKSATKEAMQALNQDLARMKPMVDELSYESDYIAPFTERDPHFGKVVAEEEPDIVILGYEHMPYLVEHCFSDGNHSLIYIPSDCLSDISKTD